MKHIHIILLLLLNLYSDSFKSETSPYLRQHADNPVHWYAWNEQSLSLAKKENKPIFLSIGYSTCHWCHVMAEESFENEELAKLFNKYFISIKVDREEMPHLDSYYQEMHKRVKGHSGGWPLNIFLTPDKKVFHMSAYIPPKSVREYVGLDILLPSLHDKFSKNLLSEDIEKYLNYVHKKALNKNEKVSLKTLIGSINKNYDDLSSGFGDTTKFPEASKVELMMDLAFLASSDLMYQNSLEMLDAMAMRGLYDHVDGGFFRYSVDVDWDIPHFEKMLYTQAEMISLYSRAFSMTNKDLYKQVVIETIDMLDRRFLDDGLYLSASDAGHGSDEGKYFVFSKEEIDTATLNNKFAKSIKDSISSSERGNFKSTIHLGFSEKERPKGFEEFKKELQKVRSTRLFPFIDRKVNTAWNALMIEALYKASIIDKKYIKKADMHLNALREYMFDKGELYHQSLSGLKPTQFGFLEDYSFLISALISGYEVTFDDEKLEFANYLLERAKEKFYKNGTWYSSDDSLDIKADLIDVHYVSAHSKMIQIIIKMASLVSSREYERLSKTSLESINKQIEQKLSDVPASARAYLMNKMEVVILKNREKTLLQDMKKIKTISYPYIVLKKDTYGKYLACTMKSCFSVQSSFKKLKKSIELRQYN